MIAQRDLEEIRKRDFLEIKNHYREFDDVETKLVFGKRMNNAFLTVIIPVYDHPFELMKRAVDSVLNQYCDYAVQVLVIDDYASREGVSPLEEYLRSINDNRVIYYRNCKNLGVFGNWNRGIELSNSEWITILHTDDFYKCNFLQTMKDIVVEHPEIDQLACNYKLIDIVKFKQDIAKEFRGNYGVANVYKVSYLDYMYEMYTSVKGAFYKREVMIALGGFRSQGDGLGLDDYPLMMKYAYYYNTYLLDKVMYVDSWGYNDSLNTKHWYPELVENYYMWIYFANKEKGVVKRILKKRAQYLLSFRAREFNDGTSWVGVPVAIDFEELMSCCNVKKLYTNRFMAKVLYYLSKGIIKVKKGDVIGFTVLMAQNETNYKLR